ncbi:hypothetical protein BT63DRAFT_98639 [Microthyrium microscopicum]|uniref:Uncharacterized protein n=1 Tax=Microthyrium microscopicum TaxID=703497 RepID=A0A6A6U1J4_9PEZI|nr:hypothetical protein BT63DRAFT_98639 [Microthyrium microscopicum]
MLSFLTAIHRPTLNALIDGDLAYQVVHKADINERARKMRDEAPYQIAGIYYIVLADKCGLSPSTTVLMQVYDLLLHYMEETEDMDPQYYAAFEDLDSFKHRGLPKKWKSKWRKHLMKMSADPNNRGQQKFQISSTRKRKLETFLNNLDGILQQIPEADRDKPFPYPLRDVGFSSDMPRCYKQHVTHLSTNWLMALLDAAINVTVRRNNGLDNNEMPYPMMYIVLGFLWSPIHASLAEFSLTRLASAYSDKSGVGLNTHPAGRSVGFPHDEAESEDDRNAAFEAAAAFSYTNCALYDRNEKEEKVNFPRVKPHI